MKKTFGILGAGLLLASNVLMSFSNVSFALQDIGGYDYYPETNGCYVYADYVKPTKGVANSYGGTMLLAYKCDVERGTVDLTKMPLEDGQYLVSVGPNAFSGTNVTKVIMPSTVMGIGNGAFCNAEKVGTGCGNGIIEQGEECDDGNEGSYYCTSQCEKTLCGNGKVDEGEDCLSCPLDFDPNGVYCDDLNIKSMNEFEESEYKGEYREISASLGPVDNTNFVVVDFSGGMNDEFDIEDLDYACAKLQEYTITFKTEDGIDLGTGGTYNQYLNPRDIPDAPEKEGFIGTWYLGNEIFDVNNQITDDITLVYKYEKGGIEYDEENGWIKVSLGDQEIIIKDKNQGAEKSVNEVDTGNSSDFINAIGTYYLWGNNTGLDSSEIFDDNGLVDLDDVKLPEGFDHGYLGLEGGDDWTMGSNDTPCNVDSGEYLPSPDEWKNLMQIRGKINGYELNHDNMGYYFDDMNMGYVEQKNVTKSLTLERAYGGMDSSITKFLNDLYIGFYPSLYIDNGGISFNSNMQFYPSSLNNGKIGYFTSNGLPVYDESNLYGFENDYATPVRCFVKPQFEVSFEVNGGTDVVTQKIFSGDRAVEPEEVQKENAEFLGWFTEDGTKFNFDTPITSDIKLHAEWQEKKTNNGYSGGGGGGSSSSNIKNSDKSDDSYKDKVSPASEAKENPTSEKKVDKEQQNNVVNNNQNQNEKTETVVIHKVSYVPDTTLSEDEQAYNFAYAYGITNKTSVESAQMNSPLTRIQMAKILSQYAINVLGKTPDTSKNVRFKDVTDKKDLDYDNGVTLSYQLGIMGQNMKNGKFRPDDEVTRAEFVTALSRLLYSTSDGKYKSTSKYYTYHMEKLKEEGIITKDNPKMKEKRGYVMIMLMRSVK